MRNFIVNFTKWFRYFFFVYFISIYGWLKKNWMIKLFVFLLHFFNAQMTVLHGRIQSVTANFLFCLVITRCRPCIELHHSNSLKLCNVCSLIVELSRRTVFSLQPNAIWNKKRHIKKPLDSVTMHKNPSQIVEGIWCTLKPVKVCPKVTFLKSNWHFADIYKVCYGQRYNILLVFMFVVYLCTVYTTHVCQCLR